MRASRIRHAPEETLGWSPPWTLTLIEELARTNGALIAITGDPEPELLSELDPGRIARTHPRASPSRCSGDRRRQHRLDDRRLPERGLGAGGLRRAGRRAALGGGRDATRLDEDDPVAAWRDHIAKLARRAEQLNERRFDGPASQAREPTSSSA